VCHLLQGFVEPVYQALLACVRLGEVLNELSTAL
jgi:hypothetical protein